MAGKVKISAADWAYIVTTYQRGEKNINELGEEFGVLHQTISKGLRDRGISRASRLAENIVDEEDNARKEREEKVQAAKRHQERYAKFNDVIAQMVMKRVIEGDQQSNLKIYHADVLVLNNASKVVQRSRRENWEILKVEDLLDGEDSLPDLNIGEYTPEELIKIREANEENYLESIEDESSTDDLDEAAEDSQD